MNKYDELEYGEGYEIGDTTQAEWDAQSQREMDAVSARAGPRDLPARPASGGVLAHANPRIVDCGPPLWWVEGAHSPKELEALRKARSELNADVERTRKAVSDQVRRKYGLPLEPAKPPDEPGSDMDQYGVPNGEQVEEDHQDADS